MSIAEKLTTIAENQQAVFEAGKRAGGGDGHYDTFWDAYQDNGSRTTYQYAFAGIGWDDDIFNPKHSLSRIGSCAYMFAQSKVTDISRLGKITITSSAFSYMFWQARQMTHICEIELLNANGKLTGFCQDADALVTFDKLIVNAGNDFTNAFHTCTSLVNIAFEGNIGKSINFKDSPLSRASIESVVGHLSDSVTGQTATFKRTAVEAAFTTAEWNALVATRTNWTIALNG
jgi:hypothetical protein